MVRSPLENDLRFAVQRLKMERKSSSSLDQSWWRTRLRSFSFAVAGILSFFRTEANAWIHLAFSVIVAVLCWFLPVSKIEMILLVFSVAMVWITEMLNTAIEKIMDFISPQKRDEVKLIKDVAAGSVLVAALAALITGISIFLPKILSI